MNESLSSLDSRNERHPLLTSPSWPDESIYASLFRSLRSFFICFWKKDLLSLFEVGVHIIMKLEEERIDRFLVIKLTSQKGGVLNDLNSASSWPSNFLHLLLLSFLHFNLFSLFYLLGLSLQPNSSRPLLSSFSRSSRDIKTNKARLLLFKHEVLSSILCLLDSPFGFLLRFSWIGTRWSRSKAISPT